MAKTVPLSHRLDPELKAELQRLADADRRSLTNYIEIVLEDHVAKNKGKRK
jgi:predicted transcriptional regulator